jgi:hypothetical protein
MTKARRTIAAEDVDRVFNDKYIERFAARLPTGADRRRFANAIREAARIYARDAPEPTVNELRAEIAALYYAADRRQCDRLAIRIERLSPKARNLLNRGKARLYRRRLYRWPDESNRQTITDVATTAACAKVPAQSPEARGRASIYNQSAISVA